MADKSNECAAAAIRERLARIAGEGRALEKQLRDLRAAEAALIQTLSMFDPDADHRLVKLKRPYRRAWLRGGGRLSRFVLDALRASERPMSAAEIVAALGNSGVEVPGIARRVRATLNHFARSENGVVKEGQGQTARWFEGSREATDRVMA